AGYSPVDSYILRHSWGFALANRGYDLRLIQKYLAHRDPSHAVDYARVVGSRFEAIGSCPRWIPGPRLRNLGKGMRRKVAPDTRALVTTELCPAGAPIPSGHSPSAMPRGPTPAPSRRGLPRPRTVHRD